MDSINLTETQSTSLNCRNTASNTSPITCACCGSKDYLQTIPQANYFRTLCHGISRCKQTQDNCDENCIIPPFFSSIPLFQPFFNSFPMPANTYCPHNRLDEATTGSNHLSEQNQAENNKKKPHSGDYYAFHQKEKSDCKSDKTLPYENLHKNSMALGAESQFSAYPFFIPFSKDMPYFQRCVCGDSKPWTSSPFIIPMVSYCLFWNSQKASNDLSANYSGNQPGMMFSQNNEAPLANSSSNTTERQTKTNINIINNHNANNWSDNKSQAEEDFLRSDSLAQKELKRTDHKSKAASSSPLTSYSINFTEDSTSNSSNNSNKNDENDDFNDLPMEEDLEMDGFLVAGQVESDECFKMNENTPSSSKVQLSISLNSNEGYLNRNEDITQQKLPPKVHEKVDSSAEQLSPSRGEENDFLSQKRPFRKLGDLDEESGNILPEYKATIFKERMSFKKLIKNFTITDVTTDGLTKEAHIYAAAAGDLGGEHCAGYKVQIPPSKIDEQEKIRQETQTEVNLEAKETLLIKGLAELKEKQPGNFLEKNAPAKNLRYKSNIAKPSKTPKQRDTKQLDTKKDIKVTSQEECYIVKRKHNCFPTVNAMGISENGSELFKIKNYSANQQQSLGSGRPQRTINTKTRDLKKEVDTSNSRPLSKQKLSNTIIKTMKK